MTQDAAMRTHCSKNAVSSAAAALGRAAAWLERRWSRVTPQIRLHPDPSRRSQAGELTEIMIETTALRFRSLMMALMSPTTPPPIGCALVSFLVSRTVGRRRHLTITLLP